MMESFENNERPLVSVCIQTYNQESFISTCIDSILSQKTSFPFEIIIGEDDSSDRTREICIQYSKKHPDKIRLFLRDQKDRIFINGVKTGRFNFLENLKSSRGDYICLCDGDDYWTDNQKLEKQFQFLTKNPDVFLVYSSYTHERNDKTTFVESVLDKIFRPDELKTIHYLGHVSTWMFKNEINSIFTNPIVYKAFAMDMVLFAYSKTKGNIAGQSFNSSFYRYNSSGIFRSKSSRKTAKDFALIHLYFFCYIHLNINTLISSGTGYYLKKYLKSFF